MTVHELHARRRKVTAMANLLRSKGADCEDLDCLDEEGWIAAARLVGSGPPSEKTKQMVIEEMENAK